jgi:hypothetical protein
MKIVNEVSSKKEQYGTVAAQVHDKHGNLLQEVEIPVDSFNRQMWRAVQANFAVGNGPVTALNNSNSSITIARVIADGVINDYRGIVVGSGTTATTYDTVLMQTLIGFGSGNGELYALPCTAEYDVSTRISTLTRSFISVNENSSPIPVNEVGICVSTNTGINPTSTANSLLFIRDVLPSTLTVPYEGMLTVQYKLRIASGNNNYSNVFIRPYGYGNDQPDTRLFANTNGNLINIALSSINELSYRVTGEEGNTRRGLNFGTSTTAFNVAQVDLQGKIPHGNGAGQLFYHPTSNTTIQENSTTNSCRFIYTRAVENRSGAPIDINEVGIYIDMLQSAPQSFMLDRKVLENTVTLQDTNIVTFWWEFCYEL